MWLQQANVLAAGADFDFAQVKAYEMEPMMQGNFSLEYWKKGKTEKGNAFDFVFSIMSLCLLSRKE